MRSREQAEQIINALFGYDTEPGRKLAADLIEELGAAALTDEALSRLAAKHEGFDQAETLRRELEWRRRERGY